MAKSFWVLSECERVGGRKEESEAMKEGLIYPPPEYTRSTEWVYRIHFSHFSHFWMIISFTFAADSAVPTPLSSDRFGSSQLSWTNSASPPNVLRTLSGPLRICPTSLDLGLRLHAMFLIPSGPAGLSGPFRALPSSRLHGMSKW